MFYDYKNDESVNWIFEYPNNWEDTTWGNDVCPSASKDFGDYVIRIWLDYPKQEDRESDSEFRFNVVAYTDDMDYIADIKAGSDLNSLVEWVYFNGDAGIENIIDTKRTEEWQSNALDDLTNLYVAWCKLEAYPMVSAEEQEPEQMKHGKFLADFITLWDTVQDYDRSRN